MKSLFLAVCLFVAPLAAQANTMLSFDPTFQTVPLGSLASVDVVVSGLEQGQSLGAFDFTFFWDSTVLSLNSSSFSSALGSDLNRIDVVVPAVGSVNAASVSFEDPATLLALQAGGPFSVFTAVFNTLSVGTTSLTFAPSPFVFSDGEGVDIAGVTGSDGRITVTDGVVTVPDAGSTMLMMFVGLGPMWLRQRRQGLKG